MNKGKEQSSLILYYQNVRSIRNKTYKLEESLPTFINTPDIIVLSETWLDHCVNDYELNLYNYSVFRSDRSLDSNGDTRRGGGVLIAISKEICSSLLSSSYNLPECNIEELFVRITLPDKSKIIIGAVYFPPLSTPDDYFDHVHRLDLISEAYADHKILICGDYNLAKISWSYDDCLRFLPFQSASSGDKVSSSIICNGYSTYNLHQHFPIHEAKNYTLDLLFGECDMVKYLHSDDQLVPPDTQHHFGASFSINCMVPEVLFRHSVKYNFKKIDLGAMHTCLSSINWNYLLNFELLGLNGVVDLFYDVLYAAIDIAVPKIGQFKKKFPCWYTDELKGYILQKKALHKFWKISNNLSTYIEFKRIRALCISLSRQAHKEYLLHIQTLARSNLKEFWKHVNSKRKDPTIPNNMNLNDIAASDPGDIAELFAEHFRSVYKSPKNAALSSDKIHMETDLPTTGSTQESSTQENSYLNISINDVIWAINKS